MTNSDRGASDQDLRRNPGIGQSPGTFATGKNIDLIEGDNTVEGDIDNDAGPGGGVNLKRDRARRR